MGYQNTDVCRSGVYALLKHDHALNARNNLSIKSCTLQELLITPSN